MSQRERVLCDFAVKVCRAPDTCSPEDVERLRSEELSDADVTSLVEIVALLNMTNRMFESLSTIE